MTALSPAAETMIRKRIAARAVNVSGLVDLVRDLRTARDPREADVIRFMALMQTLINEAPK